MKSKAIKLITGTNIKTGDALLRREFDDISSWSNNKETADHYYAGRMIEIDVRIDETKAMEYILELDDLKFIGSTIDKYTYGFAEVKCPTGAIWYSFSKSYLEDNVLCVREICNENNK